MMIAGGFSSGKISLFSYEKWGDSVSEGIHIKDLKLNSSIWRPCTSLSWNPRFTNQILAGYSMDNI